MRIILTGANGNLGRQIIAQNSVHEVVPIHRNNWALLETLSLGREDVIIHAASDLTTPISQNPASVLDSNVGTTARLLEKSKGCGRFIFISSCAVYGDALKTNENTICRPLSVNGIIKLLNERVVEEFCTRHGIPYLILRIFNTYGGDDRFSIISKLQKSLADGAPFQLNNQGIAQRDFVHVSDVAGVVLRLLDCHLPFTCLNVGTGDTTKIKDVVDAVRQFHPQLKVINKDADEVEYSRADIARLRATLDYQFINIHEQLPILFPV